MHELIGAISGIKATNQKFTKAQESFPLQTFVELVFLSISLLGVDSCETIQVVFAAFGKDQLHFHSSNQGKKF